MIANVNLVTDLQATFAVTLEGVSVVDFNAQRQAAFLQVTAGFMGVPQSSLQISSIDGLLYNGRSASSSLPL